MKRFALLFFALPLAACASEQQSAQYKADLLRRAEAACGGTSDIDCLNEVVARKAVNMKVVRQADGSVQLAYGTFTPHSVGGQVMSGDNAAAAGTMGAATDNPHAFGNRQGVPLQP